MQLIDIAQDDGLFCRIGNAMTEPTWRQAGTNGEYDVALVQIVRHLIAAHADEQRMILRERPFRLERRDDRHVRQLRQRLQLFGSTGIDDPFACVDQRIACSQELINGNAHIRGVRRRFPALHWTVRVGCLVVCGRGIGNGQDHGPRSAAAQHGEGAAHKFRRTLGLIEIAEPLRHCLHSRDDIVLAVARRSGRHAIGDAKHRRAILIGLCQPSVGVLHAGGIDAALERANPDPCAASDARERVGDRDSIAIVAHHQHRHPFPAERVVHAADGKGRNPTHTLLLENAANAGRHINRHGWFLPCTQPNPRFP